MIVVAKAADVLIQPRVLKAASTIKSLCLDYKIIGIASDSIKIKDTNKLVILNISVSRTIIFNRSRLLRRIIKLFKYFAALYVSRGNYYLVHDPLTLVLTYFIKIIRNNISIIYMGDELEIGRKYSLFKRLYVNFLMKSTPYFCSHIFQADYYRKEAFQNFLKYNKVKVLRNVPNKIFSFSNIDIRKKYNIDKNNKIFIYTGLISENRGLLTTIKGLSILSNNISITLILIGWGPKNDLKNIKEYSILKESKYRHFKVLFINQMPIDDLFNWIRQADVGIGIIANYNQSYYLCTPSKVYEYMMAGIPFLASNFPENRLLVKQTNSGILVDPSSPKDICLKAYNLLSDVGKQNRMGRLGRIAALDKYNWEYESKILKKIIH
jgi:glycosyltransferase involved in cell wall biosynthesis